jgi:hypothetical protein
MISIRAGSIEDLVLLLDLSITNSISSPPWRRARVRPTSLSLSCSSTTTLSAPCPPFTAGMHTTTTRSRRSKSDDATRTANQFQRACAKHHRLAPVAPLSLSLTTGEGEGRSRTCHIFCLFPAVLHATHAHAHTHTHGHTHFPPTHIIFSLFVRFGTGLGWPSLVRRTRRRGCKSGFKWAFYTWHAVVRLRTRKQCQLCLVWCAPMTVRLPWMDENGLFMGSCTRKRMRKSRWCVCE